MSNRMWGGRFGDGPDDIMEEINASIGFDQRLSGQDLRGSRAHCRMLIAQGIISEVDGKAILSGLDKIETQIENKIFLFNFRMYSLIFQKIGFLKKPFHC